jgi:hypothetical protein
MNPETTEQQTDLEIAIAKLKEARSWQAETAKRFTKADCENEMAITRHAEETDRVTMLIDNLLKYDRLATAVKIGNDLFVRAPFNFAESEKYREWVLTEVTNIDINAKP